MKRISSFFRKYIFCCCPEKDEEDLNVPDIPGIEHLNTVIAEQPCSPKDGQIERNAVCRVPSLMNIEQSCSPKHVTQQINSVCGDPSMMITEHTHSQIDVNKPINAVCGDPSLMMLNRDQEMSNMLERLQVAERMELVNKEAIDTMNASSKRFYSYMYHRLNKAEKTQRKIAAQMKCLTPVSSSTESHSE